MARFKVVLDDIELSDDQQLRIHQAISQAVLNELATIDTGGDRAAVIFPRLGPEIAGLIASLAQIDQVQKFSRIAEIQEREFQSW